jgi:hypothetical protein
MARILISVTTDSGEHAAIGLDVQERQAKDFFEMIHRCERFAMNYEVSSTIAAAIRFMTDPVIVKWSALRSQPVPAEPKPKLANG